MITKTVTCDLCHKKVDITEKDNRWEEGWYSTVTKPREKEETEMNEFCSFACALEFAQKQEIIFSIRRFSRPYLGPSD